jgi:hypothetical protein
MMAAPMASPLSTPLTWEAGVWRGAGAGAAGRVVVAVATRAEVVAPGDEAGRGAAGARGGWTAGVAAADDGGGEAAAGAAAEEGGGGPPAGSVGNLIVGEADGFGGRLMRTVSFFGCTFAGSDGLGGTAPDGRFGMLSAINRCQPKVRWCGCQTCIWKNTGRFCCKTGLPGLGCVGLIAFSPATLTAAIAATAITASASASAAGARSAFFPGARDVHSQGASLKIFAVKHFHRPIGFFRRRILDKGKSAGFPGEFVQHQVNGGDNTCLGE